MSKDFDSALADALDHTAHAVQTNDPGAARIRGRKRTMRKRIALSTTSLVLVAIGATAAFKATSSTGGGPPQLTAASPSHSASGSPTAGPTITASISASPSSVASSSRSTSTTPSSLGSTGSTASNPSASGQTGAADPQQVVQAAWLSASQLPFASTFHWQAGSASSTGGQQLTSTVAYLANNTSLQTLTMCADPTKLLARTIGAQVTAFNATAGSGNNQASQYIFFFANATSAQQTYAWLQSQYSTSCLLNGTGAQVTKTYSEGSTAATWLTLPGTSNSPDLPKYSREYFVLRGSTIAYVSVTSYTNTLSTTYADAGQVSTIAAHLCVYGGSCS